MAMTNDLIKTRRYYHRLYGHWPAIIILIHLQAIDEDVDQLKADGLVEARQLMDIKLPQWR